MYLINEVSRKVELSQKRIREYEKEGFILPEREANTNNRLYSDFEVSQIRRINFLIHGRGFNPGLFAQPDGAGPLLEHLRLLPKGGLRRLRRTPPLLLGDTPTSQHPVPRPLRTLRGVSKPRICGRAGAGALRRRAHGPGKLMQAQLTAVVLAGGAGQPPGWG